MKFKQKKSSKSILSDKIADSLTVRARADIEDDHIFNTKPNTVSRADYSSESEDEAAISDFRKRTANLLSDISKKYEGKVVSRNEFEGSLNSSDLSDDGETGEGLPDSSKGSNDDEELTKEVPGKHKNKGASSDDDSEDDSVESNDYSIIKKDAKKVKPNKVSGENDGNSSEENVDYSIIKKQIQGDSDEDQSDVSDEEEEEEDGEGYDISQMDEPIKEQFEHVKKQNVSEEAKKGACVRNQLLIWEGLLEMRIHLQRCMNTANMMPIYDKYDQMKQCKEFSEESKVTVNNVVSVLDKFLTLQNMLLKNFPETKSLSNKKQTDTKTDAKKERQMEESDEEIPSDTDNEEIPSDTDPEDNVVEEKSKTEKSKSSKTFQRKRKLEDYESDLSTSHKGLKTFRDTTIQKWNEKTRITTAANIKNTPTNTILQQISYILSDRNKLIRRTQLKRSDYNIIGYEKPEENKQSVEVHVGENGMAKDRKDDDEYIPEIFDDSDFYHQLLRELIECKSADISDPVQLSRQWIALQQMRSKMKRKVDTRATKGRKIKYVVHNPLVSYMAPEKSLKWNEESTNELYSSLFGKMFENNNVGINVDLTNVKIKD